LNETIKK